MNRKSVAAIFLVLCTIIIGCSLYLLLESEIPSVKEKQDQTEIVDENLLTVKVTIPAEFFFEDSPATDKLTDEQKVQGYKKAVLNTDGSVTYTIKKSSWRKIVADMKQTTEETINSFANSVDTPSIKAVNFNSNFSDINLYVNRIAYENSFDTMSPFIIYINAAYYRLFNGEDADKISCVVKLYDTSNNNVMFDTIRYPEDFGE